MATADTLSSILVILDQILPGFAATLNPPCDPQDLQELERELGEPLPESVRALYEMHDGQSSSPGLFLGLRMPSAKQALRDMKMWSEMHESMGSFDTSIRSVPLDHIREHYGRDSVVPIATDEAGKLIGVDLDPAELGTTGQIINYGSDQEDQYVIASSLDGLLAFMLEQLQTGNYVIREEEVDEDETVSWWTVKTPENYDLLEAVHDMKLPLDQPHAAAATLANPAEFQAWKAALPEPWVKLVDSLGKGAQSFEGLANIGGISLLGLAISDLTPIAKCSGVRQLYLSRCPITDISPLASLSQLRKLYLTGTQVKNFSTLSALANLSELSLSEIPQPDLQPLLHLKRLKSLSLHKTGLTDLTMVAKLKGLTNLDLSSNNIASFEPLRSLTQLRELNLSGTNPQNLDFLSALPDMENLKLGSD